MADRTVSIVIDVTGADDAAREVRRVRSAFDDLLGGGPGRRDSLALFARRGREVEDLLRRIATGARSAADVWKNVWREAADFFRRIVQEMAGAWATNLGGIVPLLPGGAFGFGSSGAALHGLDPLSGSTLLAGGSLLGGLTIGSRNRIVSALGGLGSGALTGFSLGGPVGAVLGGIVGGIVGLFRGGGGQEKRHDAEIANRGFAQLAQILEDYNHFRRDFASAVNDAYRIWNQMQSQWVRPQSAPSQWPYFAAILRAIEQTEDERNRRRQRMALGPVPEFAEGGFVGVIGSRGSTGGRGTLALLHPGEYVLNRQAVDRLGVNLLETMNRSSASSDSSASISVSLEPASVQSLAEMLKRNPQALEEGLLVVLRRGGAASRALRG